MENLFWIGFVGALVAALFAWSQAKRVLSYSEGTERMQKIAASIRAGANAYLRQQYTTVFKVFVVVFIILLVIAFLVSPVGLPMAAAWLVGKVQDLRYVIQDAVYG